MLWWKPWPAAGQIDRSLARAASIAIVLLLAHSLVDYPLRTTAMMTLAAFLCALMVQPLKQREPEQAAEHVARAKVDIPTSPADLVRPRRPERWGTEIEWPERMGEVAQERGRTYFALRAKAHAASIPAAAA